MFERTSVGLDVHARTVVSCALDAQTGEMIMHRMTQDHGEISCLDSFLAIAGASRLRGGPDGLRFG
jgi:hypothetical protein